MNMYLTSSCGTIMTPINYLLHLISVGFLACKDIGNASASLSITVLVDGFAHGFVGYCIVKQCADFVHNLVVISSNEMSDAAGSLNT